LNCKPAREVGTGPRPIRPGPLLLVHLRAIKTSHVTAAAEASYCAQHCTVVMFSAG
jgi:hypothetical protein